MNVRQTVVIRPGGLGDLVLSTPALRASMADRSSRLFIDGRWRSLFDGCVEWNARSSLKIPIEIEDLRDPRWAPLFDPARAELDDALAGSLAAELHIAVYRARADAPPLPALRALFGDKVIHLRTAAHDDVARGAGSTDGVPLWKRLLSEINDATGNNPACAPEEFVGFPYSDHARAWVTTWRSERVLDRYACLFPFTGSARKDWPLACWVELAARLKEEGIVPVFVVEPGREHPAFAAQTTLATRDLGQVHALLSDAAVCLGGDTGLSHLAAVSHAPTVVLYGPSDPVLWAPPTAYPERLRQLAPETPGPVVHAEYEVLANCMDIAR